MKNIRITVVGVTLLLVACTARTTDERVGSQRQGIDACTHPICATGGPLVAECDPCTTKLCAADPYCCSTDWDATCVGEVGSICGQSCTAPPPPPVDAGPSQCAHPICATGGALVSGCEPCTATLCAADPYCCAVEWDATCVGEVGSICGASCN